MKSFLSWVTLFSLATFVTHAQIAVLVDKDWAKVGRNEFMPAAVCARVLEEHGLKVLRLTAIELADPTKLDAARWPVLLMAYGRAFPLAARENLVRYRKAGGSWITHEAPFTESAVKIGTEWETQAIAGVGSHSADGLATGSWLGPVEQGKPFERGVPPNPLGITPQMLESHFTHQQRLNPKSFPEGDEVIPIVTIKDSKGDEKPIAALIKHHCPAANGARDVWLGFTVRNLDVRERWFAEQLVVRGALWSLHETKTIDNKTFTEGLAKLDQIPKPEPQATQLPIQQTTRPWGNTMVPKSNPPAKRLQVVDLTLLNRDERAALCCLQGLTARKQPRIWTLRSNAADESDRFWLDWHVECGAIEGYEIVGNWTQLVEQYRDEIKGAVIVDRNIYCGHVIAMNVAACEDAILCTPELAKRLNLPIKVDLRGRFKSYLEGMEWVWTHYRDQLSRHAMEYFYPARLNWSNTDMAYQWKIPMVWNTLKGDAHEPMADPALEHAFVGKVLASLDTHSIVTGWPAYGKINGVNEYIAVMQATSYSHGYVPSDGLANWSVMNGVRMDPLPQPKQSPEPVLEKGKVYLSFVISDGDNLSPWMGYFRDNYFSKDSATIPLGITISPQMQDAMPAVARWYYQNAKPDTEFVCGVSGGSYISPEVFASRLSDPEAAWTRFFADTTRLMNLMDLQTLNISPRGEPFAPRYSKSLPFCHSIINSWGRKGDDPADLITTLPDGKPAFWSGTGGIKFGPSPTVDGGKAMVRAFYDDLKNLAQKQKNPLIVCDVASCWEWKKAPIQELVAQKPENVVFVTPSQLAKLFHASKSDSTLVK